MKKQVMIITLLLSMGLGFTALSADSDFYVIPIKKTVSSTGGGALHVIDANGLDRGIYTGTSIFLAHLFTGSLSEYLI